MFCHIKKNTFLFLIPLILVFLGSCDVDYLTGGEARIILETDDYNIVYSHDFNVTISLKDKETSHSAEMVKNAAGDGTSAVFQYMKAGKWEVEIEIEDESTVRLVSGTTMEIESREVSNVRGRVTEDGEELTLVWDGSEEAVSSPSNVTVNSFNFFNLNSFDYSGGGYGENLDISAGILKGTGFNELEYFSLLYPDGSRFESGIPRGIAAYEVFSDDSTFLGIFRAGHYDSGTSTLIFRDINGNSFSMENGIEDTAVRGTAPSEIYPEHEGTASSTGDNLSWNYSDGGDWINSQLFVIINRSDGSVFDKAVLLSDNFNRSISGMNPGDRYSLLILACDAPFQGDILDYITVDTVDPIIPFILDHIETDYETDYMSYYLGDFYAGS